MENWIEFQTISLIFSHTLFRQIHAEVGALSSMTRCYSVVYSEDSLWSRPNLAAESLGGNFWKDSHRGKGNEPSGKWMEVLKKVKKSYSLTVSLLYFRCPCWFNNPLQRISKLKEVGENWNLLCSSSRFVAQFISSSSCHFRRNNILCRFFCTKFKRSRGSQWNLNSKHLWFLPDFPTSKTIQVTGGDSGNFLAARGTLLSSA